MPKHSQLWYNIRRAMVLMKDRLKSPYEVFGCIPHGARAYLEGVPFNAQGYHRNNAAV